MASSVRLAIVKLIRDDIDADPEGFWGDIEFPDNEHVYHRSAPQDVDFPMVIVARQAGAPMYSFGTGPSCFFENDLWTIKGVDRGLSSEKAEFIDERLFTILQDQELDLSGMDPPRETMWFRREEAVDYGEREEGAVIHHVGAMYRLFTEAA